MITLKKWNSLSAKKRKDIASLVFNDTPADYQEAAAQEFHHDFSYQAKGEGYFHVSTCLGLRVSRHFG